MAAHPNLRFRLMMAATLGMALAGCASTPHVTAFQEHPIVAAPRSLTLAIVQDEKLPFGIAPDLVAEAAAKAGFALGGEASRYRLMLAAAAGASDAGSYLPGQDGSARSSWIARPDRNWRARFAGGHVLRITAVLIDSAANREVWRGTGTLRTSDPRAAAPELAREVLAKLPLG